MSPTFDERAVDIIDSTDPFFEAYRFKRFIKNLTGDDAVSTHMGVLCSELVSSMVKGGKPGAVKCSVQNGTDITCIELFAEHYGVYFDDMQAQLDNKKDCTVGISTLQRLMDEVEIRNIPGKGTQIILKKRMNVAPPDLRDVATPRV